MVQHNRHPKENREPMPSSRPAGSIRGARELARDLRKSGEQRAPESLLPNVLLRTGLADAYWRQESAIGPVYIAHNVNGISSVMQSQSDDEFEQAFEARFGRHVYPAPEPPAELARIIATRLLPEQEGETSRRRTAPLRFDLRGLSTFQRSVLEQAARIPSGQVRPYSWVAREIGHPGASRAVGSALGHNPIPLLIPCHRVTRADGHPGDYALGRAAKRVILDAEGLSPEWLDQLADDGVRFTGSDTTHIFCFPTCSHARRTTERHLVAFTSASQARQAGYRPCKVCRPELATAS